MIKNSRDQQKVLGAGFTPTASHPEPSGWSDRVLLNLEQTGAVTWEGKERGHGTPEATPPTGSQTALSAASV